MRRFATAAAVLSCLACKTPIVPQLTSSGSMGVVTVGSGGAQKQKIFLPQVALDSSDNEPCIDVLDATFDNSSSALLDTIDLSAHVDGSLSTAVAATATVVVAVGATSPYVDFIDPVADKVTATVQLPAAILAPDAGPATFSGTSTLVQGVIIDSANNRAILATAAGFLPVDLTSHDFGTFVPAVPTENFGFWPSRDWILAPFYLCSACATPAGFQLVDMGAGQVYFLGGVDAGSELGVQPAAADIDPLTEVAIVPDQNAGTVYALNFGAVQRSADGGVFNVPIGKAPSSLASALYSGVAIDQVNHQAFLEQAGGIDIAVVALPQLLVDAGAVNPTTAALGTMPNPPSGGGWTNSGDPHGIAVAVGLASGNPEGFLANQGNTQVARIDLDGFASAGPGQVSAATLSSLVTFIPNHN